MHRPLLQLTKSKALTAFTLSAALLLCSPHIIGAPIKSWSGNYPTVGSVSIPAGETVLLDTDLNLSNLSIAGKVVCANKNLSIRSGWIMVQGMLVCGTPTQPYLNKLTVTLTGNNTTENIMGMGSKFLGAMNGGSIQLQGAPRINWLRLGATVIKGASQISLQQNVDWKVGEKIVIASSDYRPEHAEEVTITGINGKLVNLSAPLAYTHWCQQQTFNPTSKMAECAEVGLLSRNILIQGDTSSSATGFGGHMMIMRGSSAKIGSIELNRMGQKGLIGRYPMHWHLVGAAPGQYLTGSSIHNAYNRFFSIHGTSQLQILRNIGYETIGHGFYLEDGIEENNTLAGNLGLSVHNATDGKPTPSDRDASVFWISNPKNIIRNNVAGGSEHTGFWLGFPEHPIGLSSTDTVWPRRTPLLEFNANLSHSNSGRGLYVDGAERPDRTTQTTWYEPRVNPVDQDSALVPPVFKNFTAYKNRNEGVWIRSFAGPILSGAKLADNWMGAYFANIGNGIGYIENSIIVGETANKGNPETWETQGIDGRELPRFWSPSDSIRGIEFYDGPMVVRDTLFANFQSTTQRKSGGLSSLAPNPFWVSSRNYSENISFFNANRVYLHDLTAGNSGDAFSTFLDRDGSVSGVVRVKIVPKNPLLVTPQCTFKPTWNAYMCPHVYVNLRIFDRTGSSLSGSLLQRDDGAKLTLASPDKYSTEINASIIAARPYTLKFPNGTPKHLAFVVSEKPLIPIRLSIPYPFADFTVTFWGTPVQKVTSLSELTTGGYKYFHDGSRLHLRLVNQDGHWEEIEVKRP
jgi:cell surface hyaluronidase